MTFRAQDSTAAANRRGGGSQRMLRVAKQLREELSMLMLTEMKDPRIRMASVTDVRPSPDLRSAVVKVSALGTDAEREAVLAGLRHAEGFLRSTLGDRLENLKTIPRLHFVLDESIAYAVRVSSMLRELDDTTTPPAASRPRHSSGDTGMTATPAVAWPGLTDVADDVRRIIDSSHDIVCMAHKDADADSLGSALAFAATLRAIGKVPHPVVPDPIPFTLSYLPGYEALEREPERIDAIFTFDCATTGRFGEKRGLLESGRFPVVNIDHHVSNSAYGSVNLIQPDASATGQVVFRLLRTLGLPITPDTATNLYAALLTDTGGFRHENTTEEALRLAADLVELGADPAWIALKSYKSRAVSTLRLEALAVARMRSELDGRLVWSEVTRAMLEEAGATWQETDGVIDVLQTIDSMTVAVLFKELQPDVTKISVRTRGDVDATALCSPFGGGGHRRAAGAEIHAPMAVAQERVLQLARELLRAG
ncbi:MAG TPA: 30S ribosome-binding factor RbfA [Candidatus Dormibacteraeota bacterium]|nr:30S ribosome-binding factor RbfA [Candidatus Dormibacteraeota bacterium]